MTPTNQSGSGAYGEYIQAVDDCTLFNTVCRRIPSDNPDLSYQAHMAGLC